MLWPPLRYEVSCGLSGRTPRSNASSGFSPRPSRSNSSSRRAPSRGSSTKTGIPVNTADPRRCDSYLKCDLSPNTLLLIQDNGRASLNKIIDAARDMRRNADLRDRHRDRQGTRRRAQERDPRRHLPDAQELIAPALLTELSRSLTRARVQQYQRYFADADRVLILLHNEPDPDAMASGLALRNAAAPHAGPPPSSARIQGVTRPENLRMARPARHPGRDRHAGRSSTSSIASPPSTSSRTTSARLLERADLVDRPSPRAGRLHRGLQGHPRRLRIRPAPSSPSICGPSTSTSPNARRPRCSTPSSPTRCSSRGRPTGSTSTPSRSCIRWPTRR